MTKRTIFLCVAVLCASLIAFAGRVFAEFQFQHTPPSAQELPFPGKELSLNVFLPKEVLSVGLKVRALITKDGRLMEVQDNEPTIDTSDKAVYKIAIPSPSASVSYQFIFTDKGGASFGSPRYSVVRKCTPDTELTTVRKPPAGGQVTADDAQRLVLDAAGLARDIDSFEHVVSLLSDIHQLVDKK